MRYFRLWLDAFDSDSSNDWSTNTVSINFQPDVRFAGSSPITWISPFDPVTPTTPILVEGENIRFSFQFENIGNSYSASTTAVEAYYNTTASTTGATLLGTVPIGAIAARSGTLTSQTFTLPIPVNIAAHVGVNRFFFLQFINAGNEANTANNRSSFKTVMAGGKTDLVLHLPPVIDPLEAARPDNIPTVTWANFDNDDADSLWDSNPETPSLSDSTVTGNDDELLRAVFRLKPNYLAAHAGKSLKVNVVDGSNAIRFWKTPSKGQEYTPGVNIAINEANGFATQGDWLEYQLWIEGTRAHSAGESYSTIEFEYNANPILGNKDREDIQVLGIKSIALIGVENGYSQTTLPRHTSSQLDSYEVAWPGSPSETTVRAFTGSRTDDYTRFRDTVLVAVELTAIPEIGVDVYLRPFDIDDPLDEFLTPGDSAVLDPNDSATQNSHYPGADFPAGTHVASYTLHSDNRNTLASVRWLGGTPPDLGIPPEGRFESTDTDNQGILRLRFPFPISLKTAVFRIRAANRMVETIA
jgi:hypothetical protein